ncbi:MAG: tetratricopeptide repeat protein [Promethearchaeota archaeon]|jgi:tetratricopeptide (TPR) repeat protein
MSEQDSIENEKPVELARAEKLSDEGKLDEALTLLNNYEQKEGLSLHEKVSCHLFQCRILYWQRKYRELIKLAEQTYKESEGQQNNFLKLDSLLFKVYPLIWTIKLDEAFDLINQAEELIKIIPQKLPEAFKQRKASLAFIKGFYYGNVRSPIDIDLSLKHLEYSLALREELGIKHEIAESLCEVIRILCYYTGELDLALRYAERSLALAKESSKMYYIAWSLTMLGIVYLFKGELDQSTQIYEQNLELWKKLNNKAGMASALNNLSANYKMRGEYDRALECIEQAMAVNRDLGILPALANNHDFLIQLLIEKGDYMQAQLRLDDLGQLNSQLKVKYSNELYLLNKALVLKTSSRAIKRVKAEEILKQLLEDENLTFECRLRALLGLCELLLTELHMTNDSEVLDELNQFIDQLLEIADKSQSYWIMGETYLLQAKLSLLRFNIKEAKRFLIQAQRIAERFNLNQLVAKITSEKDILLKKLDLWEKLKETNAPIADRLELARLDEKLVGMVQQYAVLTAQVSEEKVSVSKEKKICLVCRGEVLRFLFICLCGAIYCENCVQALINLENACWVCDMPIDDLKPTIPSAEEDRIRIEEEAKKKQNLNLRKNNYKN